MLFDLVARLSRSRWDLRVLASCAVFARGVGLASGLLLLVWGHAAIGSAPPAQGPLTGFSLLYASDQSYLASITDGATITLDDPSNGSYAIRAEIAEGETVGSVRFELTGPKNVPAKTENIVPFSLYGDDGPESLHGEPLPAGSYRLTVTAFSERRLEGQQLGVLAVSFTVSAPAVVTESRADALPTPAWLSSSAGSDHVDLSWWLPASDKSAELTAVQLLRDGIVLATLAPQPLPARFTYQDLTVESSTTYSYRVRVVAVAASQDGPLLVVNTSAGELGVDVDDELYFVARGGDDPPDKEPFEDDQRDSRKAGATGSAADSNGTFYTYRDGDRVYRVAVVSGWEANDAAGGAVRYMGEGKRSDESNPVFRSENGGGLMTLPGGVLLVLEYEWSDAQVDAFFAEYRIDWSRVSEFGWLRNGFFIETEPGFPSLELANELAEAPGVLIATPNWWREVARQ